MLVHGFAGNTGEVLPLKALLEAAGYLVVCPEIAGHKSRKELGTTTFRDWIDSVKSVYLQLKKEHPSIVLIGFSMGGLINANLALTNSPTAFITINTPIYFWDMRIIARNVIYDIRTGERTHLRYYWNSTVKTPIRALLNFTILLRKTRPLFGKISCPALVLHAANDDTAHSRSARYIFEKLRTPDKKIIFYPEGGHQICHSPSVGDMASDIICFIGSLT